ncbi:MAG: CidA/LrgA family protein [Chloroflexaceae bacterium]|nr:CidA/LrgA family protein [Chloroflexaceae bacterium]NJL34163.1 CidA/LrgA family protein [Chloroflexaceae bacterium]NJO06521.1 CidA/LrgA family protein [Chloroflexaceae bacterium]
MIRAFALLLLFQLIGEIVARTFVLPIPGPVIGMLLLVGVLLASGGVPDFLQRTAEGLLAHLSLLFVPAGVGVIAHLSTLQGAWLALLITLIGSTLITIVITALVLRLFIGQTPRA